MDTPQIDLQIVFAIMAGPKNPMLKVQEFWDQLLGDNSAMNQKLCNVLWNSLDTKKAGQVVISRMKNRFFGKFHPDVHVGKAEARNVETDFIRDLDIYTQVFSGDSGRFARQEFDLFMRMWAFELDDQARFMEVVVECFRLSEIAEMVSEVKRQKQRSGVNLKKNRAHQPIDGGARRERERESGSGVRNRGSRGAYNDFKANLPKNSYNSKRSGRSSRNERSEVESERSSQK